jgi:hypothetical protein
MTIEAKKYIPLSQIAKRFPSAQDRCQHLAPSTIWRWCKIGVKTKNGRVKLLATKIGTSWFVHEDDLQKFLDSLDKSSPESPLPFEPETTKTPRRTKKSQAVQAGEELARMGA